MKISGFAFHVHHDKLVEFCRDYEERVKYIKENKPLAEQEIRLRLFKIIPQDHIPLDFIKACEAYDKAREAYNKAREAYDKAREAHDKVWEAYIKAWEAHDKVWEAYDKAREAYNKAREAYDKAREAYDKACEAYDKAREAYDKAREACLPELEILHKELCPDCPFNNKTIFIRKNEAGEWY